MTLEELGAQEFFSKTSLWVHFLRMPQQDEEQTLLIIGEYLGRNTGENKLGAKSFQSQRHQDQKKKTQFTMIRENVTDNEK